MRSRGPLASGRAWNQAVEDVQKSVGSKYHVEVAFGMADSREIQKAITALEKSKVKKIVAVPLFISSVSEVMDQTRFVLGLRSTPSKEFMNHPHAHHGAGPVRLTLDSHRLGAGDA